MLQRSICHNMFHSCVEHTCVHIIHSFIFPLVSLVSHSGGTAPACDTLSGPSTSRSSHRERASADPRQPPPSSFRGPARRASESKPRGAGRHDDDDGEQTRTRGDECEFRCVLVPPRSTRPPPPCPPSSSFPSSDWQQQNAPL